MAYTITQQGGHTRGYITSFQVDTLADVQTLPIAPEVAAGSDCVVIENGSLWVLNTAGDTWIEFGANA